MQRASLRPSKTGLARALRGLVGLLAILSLLVVDVSPAFAASRTLELYFTHTRESIKVVYKRNGSYVKSGLRDLNRFLRDWRRNEATKMDPELFDLLWELQQEFGGTIHVVSAYRSPATNRMLRRRSRGVAKKSQHMAGRAIDFYIKGANIAKVRAAGIKRQVGGVGYYPRSGSPFVHMDTGSVRAWPRMSRSQLTKIFPDGKTLHLPSDGKPLKGYAAAKKLEKEGKLASLGSGGGGGLFGFVGGLGRGTRNDTAEAGEIVRPSRRNADDRPREVRTAAVRAAPARPERPEAARTAQASAAAKPAAEATKTENEAEDGRGLFRQLPSVSLGGLIGRKRQDESADEPATVQPVALPAQPLTAVAIEPTPPSAQDETEPGEEEEAAAPIVLAALPPQRPAGFPRTGAAASEPATPALTPALAYARGADTVEPDGSPQGATAAIIPGRGLAERTTPARVDGRFARAAPADLPAALDADAASALMAPVLGTDPTLIANRADASSGGFAVLTAPDREAAVDDGLLMATGFLGAPTGLAQKGDFLDTERFTGASVTVFAAPRS